MKKNRLLFWIFGSAILVLAIIISIVAFSHFRTDDSAAESLELDTNIVEQTSNIAATTASQAEGASGITTEQTSILSAEQSQAIVDMAVCFTAFMPETDENGVVFSHSTILNYLSLYYDAFTDYYKEEKPLTYSQLDAMSQKLFGRSIPSALPNEESAFPGWSITNGGYSPAPHLADFGTASLISVEYDSDVYSVQMDIANCSWQRSSVYRLFIELLPNPDSPTGFTFQRISFINCPSKFIDRAEASSEKPTISDVSYTAANCIDGLLSTVWCENANGNGTLEWLRLYPGENTTFSAIGIVNGNVSSQESYYSNGRIRNILIQFPGGYSIREELPDDCFANNGAPYIVLLGSDIQASWVKITIESVYEGETSNDTCVSEVRLY